LREFEPIIEAHKGCFVTGYENVHDGVVDPQLLFMTDEACFHVTGYVNSFPPQKKHESGVTKILTQFTKFGYMTMIGVWCAVSRMGIIGPIFFRETELGPIEVKSLCSAC
jgi:hypothetical protein